jgi:hypothetical protein
MTTRLHAMQQHLRRHGIDPRPFVPLLIAALVLARAVHGLIVALRIGRGAGVRAELRRRIVARAFCEHVEAVMWGGV